MDKINKNMKKFISKDISTSSDWNDRIDKIYSDINKNLEKINGYIDSLTDGCDKDQLVQQRNRIQKEITETRKGAKQSKSNCMRFLGASGREKHMNVLKHFDNELTKVVQHSDIVQYLKIKNSTVDKVTSAEFTYAKRR